MASHVVVINTDLRRYNVRLQPGSYMIDVLEQACQKWDLVPERYQLKHNKKTLNPTEPFRTTGLSQGAKLELIRKSQTTSVVGVALRLPESESKLGLPANRVQGRFRSDTSLWKLLRHFEETGMGKEKGLNLTARAAPQTSTGTNSGSGQLYWEAPCLNIAGRELGSLQDLSKSLAQVGIDSGSQLVMLSFKTTQLSLQEAMQQVEHTFKDGESEDATASAPIRAVSEIPATLSTAESSIADGLSKPEAPQQAVSPPNDTPVVAMQNNSSHANVEAPTPTAQLSEPMEVDEPPSSDPLKPLEISAPSSAATIVAAERSEPESAFQPTVAQMKAHQQHLGSRTHNKRLKSDEEIEAEAQAEAARLDQVKKVDIRVRFPNNYTIKWSFGPDATGALLYEAVLGVLVHQEIYFKLTLPAGGGVIQNQSGSAHSLIKGYHLKGGVIVNYNWTDTVPKEIRSQPFLKAEYLQKAQEVVVPDIPQGTAIDEPDIPAPAKPEKKEDGGDGKKAKVPKWLKLGKK